MAAAATQVEATSADSPASLPPSHSSETPRPQLIQVPDRRKLTLKLNDINGKPRELVPRAGSVILVHFFATWCEPCREELVSLSRLVAQTPPRPITVLAVNVAEVPDRVHRFLAASPVTFPVLLDMDRAATRAWDVKSLPTTFVLDGSLMPRLFVEGDLDWTSTDVLAALDQVASTQN